MAIILAIVVNIISSLAWGFLLYAIMVIIMPEKLREKFFSLVPFYPRPKYAVLLYFLYRKANK
jgi:hypothetical protein